MRIEEEKTCFVIIGFCSDHTNVAGDQGGGMRRSRTSVRIRVQRLSVPFRDSGGGGGWGILQEVRDDNTAGVVIIHTGGGSNIVQFWRFADNATILFCFVLFFYNFMIAYIF